MFFLTGRHFIYFVTVCSAQARSMSTFTKPKLKVPAVCVWFCVVLGEGSGRWGQLWCFCWVNLALREGWQQNQTQGLGFQNRTVTAGALRLMSCRTFWGLVREVVLFSHGSAPGSRRTWGTHLKWFVLVWSGSRSGSDALCLPACCLLMWLYLHENKVWFWFCV